MKNSKTILITGATSGFGKLAVQLLLKRGHRVIAAIRGGEERLQALFAKELSEYASGRLSAIELHMEHPETFGVALKAVEERFGGRLDVLINNAGFALLGAFETQTPEQIQKQFAVNFFGPAELTRTLLPALRRAKGRILNVSSVGGRVTFPYYGTYTASKHALEAHTEGLRFELGQFGIQVGLIEPGAFQTEIINSRSLGEGSYDTKSPYYEPTRAFEQFSHNQFHLAGKPIRVARVIARLADVRRVPIRTLVGPDAQLVVWMRRLMPENWRVNLMDLAFRKIILRTPVQAQLPAPAANA